jgi:hypothetical protein
MLENFLTKKDIDMAKCLRIKCLLKSNDYIEDGINTLNSYNLSINKLNISNNKQVNNLNSNSNNFKEKEIDKEIEIYKKNNYNNPNIYSVMICLLNEIKSMKTDIFDIKNRVKVIMHKLEKNDKTDKSEKIFKNKSDFIVEENIKLDLIQKSDKDNISAKNSLNNNDINFKNNNDKKKINKQMEKIIETEISMDMDLEKEEELEKEFEKYFG